MYSVDQLYSAVDAVDVTSLKGFSRRIDYQLISQILVYICYETEYVSFLLRNLRSGKTLAVSTIFALFRARTSKLHHIDGHGFCLPTTRVLASYTIVHNTHCYSLSIP